MKQKVYCRKCNNKVRFETDKQLKKEYKYYCPNCNENIYTFETYKGKRE